MKSRMVALFALGLALALPSLARADGANPSIAAAERAYQDVDFPATREAAQHALEAGGSAPEQTARLHVLLGTSAAALGDADDAKQHFIAALAVTPELKLDKSLSPKIRDPYLQAQGYWSAAGERLVLRASPSGDDTHLVIRLQDPASLVAKITIDLALAGSKERASFTLAVAAVSRFNLPAKLRGRDYEYVLRALDRYGNELSEVGSDADPTLVRHTPAPSSAAPTTTPRGRSYLLPIALGVTGLGAVAAGVVFNVKREQEAHTWNGPSCEQPGATRLEQCTNVNDHIQSNERLAVGFYAGGGALIAGSIISLIVGRPAPELTQRASALGCTVTGPGVSCLGSF